MEFLKVVTLSIIQGITELLPISSSAHLLLLSQILDIKMNTFLLTTLHFGTGIALLMYFWDILFKDIFKIKNITFYAKILIASIPAGILGLLFESTIEDVLRDNIYISLSLILWGIVMIYLEIKNQASESEIKEITWKQSLGMGLGQSLALIPGTSRSGITTIVGMILGLNKYTALQYSFLIGLPLLFAAPIYEIFTLESINDFGYTEILGILIACISTLISLKILKRFSKEKWLTIFGIYRIILGIFVYIFTR